MMTELMELSVNKDQVRNTGAVPGTSTYDRSASSNGSTIEDPALSYRDFYPSCIADVGDERKLPRFDTFGSLMRDVNEWLLCNREWHLMKVETVMTKLLDGGKRVDQDYPNFHMASHGSNIFLSGIRLWLVPNAGRTNRKQLIHYLHIFPVDSISPELENVSRVSSHNMTSSSSEYDTMVSPSDNNDTQSNLKQEHNTPLDEGGANVVHKTSHQAAEACDTGTVNDLHIMDAVNGSSELTLNKLTCNSANANNDHTRSISQGRVVNPLFPYGNNCALCTGRCGELSTDHSEYIGHSCNTAYHSLETSCLKRGLRKWQHALKHTPLAGKVLTMETVFLRPGSNQAELTDSEPDIESLAEQTCWDENGRYHKIFIPVLRIFYLVQCPDGGQDDIDYMDFIPRIAEPARGVRKPRFELFPDVLQRVSTWLCNSPDISVINLQSLHTVIYHQQQSGEVQVSSDSRRWTEEANKTTDYLKYVRVYFRRAAFHPELSNLPRSNHISSCATLQQKVFVPTRRRRVHFDSLSDAVQRINYWIKYTGNQPWTVESGFSHFCPDHQGVKLLDNSKMLDPVHRCQGNHYVSTIRLYFLENAIETNNPSLNTGSRTSANEIEEIII